MKSDGLEPEARLVNEARSSSARPVSGFKQAEVLRRTSQLFSLRSPVWITSMDSNVLPAL